MHCSQESRVKTPVGSIMGASAVKGQHSCGGCWVCIDSPGPARLWGQKWVAMAVRAILLWGFKGMHGQYRCGVSGWPPTPMGQHPYVGFMLFVLTALLWGQQVAISSQGPASPCGVLGYALTSWVSTPVGVLGYALAPWIILVGVLGYALAPWIIPVGVLGCALTWVSTPVGVLGYALAPWIIPVGFLGCALAVVC